VALDAEIADGRPSILEFVALDKALESLAAVDPRKEADHCITP